MDITEPQLLAIVLVARLEALVKAVDTGTAGLCPVCRTAAGNPHDKACALMKAKRLLEMIGEAYR